MKKLMLATVFASLAGMSAAQVVQSGVTGASGNPNYPLEIVGSNGVLYHCRDDTEQQAGQTVRRCIRAVRRGGMGNAGALGALGLGLGAILLVAADDT